MLVRCVSCDVDIGVRVIDEPEVDYWSFEVTERACDCAWDEPEYDAMADRVFVAWEYGTGEP